MRSCGSPSSLKRIMYSSSIFSIDLGFDVLRLARGELAARVRFELAADELQFLRHLLDAHAERLGQFGQLVLLQLAEMFANHLRGQPVAVAQIVELQQQALLQVARADARQVELCMTSSAFAAVSIDQGPSAVISSSEQSR